jgi:hypothetical protein
LAGGLVLLVSGCGGSGSAADSGANGDVASLSEGSTPAVTAEAGTADAPSNSEDAFALFDECMTDAGFDFGDIDDSGEGIIVIEGEVSDSDDPQSDGGVIENFDGDAFEEANSTCSEHLANVDNAFDLSPEQEVEFEEAERSFRACMKEYGIDVPELGGDGGVINIGGSPDEADSQGDIISFDDDDFDFEQFQEAANKCGNVFNELDDGEES